MKVRIITLLSALAVFMISCENKNGSVWDDPEFIRVAVRPEGVAASPKPYKIDWKDGQTIKVFDDSGGNTELVVNKAGGNMFYSYDWTPGQVPAVAVYSHKEQVCLTSDGKLVFEIPESQATAPEVLENFASVGLINGSDRKDYEIEVMKNLTGFVSLYIDLPQASAIRIVSMGGENMTGTVAADYAGIESGDEQYWTPYQQLQAQATLVSSQPDGVLETGMYYVALLPGMYERGFKVTVLSGTQALMEKVCCPGGVCVGRSQAVFLDSFCQQDSALPDEISMEVDFSVGWPFNEKCVPQEQQAVTGETYTYNYRHNGNQMVTSLEFRITRGSLAGDKSYQWEDGALWFDSDPYETNTGVQQVNSTAMVALPIIPDRYLVEVRAVHDNAQKPYPRFNFNKGYLKSDGQTLDASYGLTYGRIAAGQPTIMSLPFTMSDGTVIESQLGQIYSLRMRDNDTRLTKVILKYSKTR